VNDSGPSASAPPGLLESLRRALATAVELLRVRLTLVGVDLETAVQHWLRLLVWLLVAFFTGALATMMLVVTVLIAFWDTHRMVAAGVITAVLAGAMLISLLMVSRQIRTRPHPLASTLAELRNDATSLQVSRALDTVRPIDRTEP
jgi:uncharacterized membrane protein YqjE